MKASDHARTIVVLLGVLAFVCLVPIPKCWVAAGVSPAKSDDQTIVMTGDVTPVPGLQTVTALSATNTVGGDLTMTGGDGGPQSDPGYIDDHTYICRGRWMVSNRSECPDVELRAKCKTGEWPQGAIYCGMPDADRVVKMGRIDQGCDEVTDSNGLQDEWLNTIRGVPMAVWKARCVLWSRGEYQWAADAGVTESR